MPDYSISVKVHLHREANTGFYRIEYRSDYILDLKMLPFVHEALTTPDSTKFKDKEQFRISGKILRSEFIFCPKTMVLFIFDQKNLVYRTKISPKRTNPDLPNTPAYGIDYKNGFIANHNLLFDLTEEQNPTTEMTLNKVFKHDTNLNQVPDVSRFFTSYTNTDLMIMENEFKDFDHGNETEFKLKCYMRVEMTFLYLWIMQ
jgi:hypothetical protein